MTIDVTTWAGIAAIVTALISAGKKFLPALVLGREALFSLALGITIACVAKLTGLGWGDVSWVNLVIAGFSSGIGAQVIHDKALNPMTGKTVPGSAPTSPTSHFGKPTDF